jgi:hypothetical protein
VTFLTAAMRLVERIKPILVGQPPALQGGARINSAPLDR